MVARPWEGIGLGLAIGFIGIRVESRYRARTLDAMAERSIRKARRAVAGILNPDLWALSALWIVAIALSCAMAWSLGATPFGAIIGIMLARVFGYPARKRLYGTAKAKYLAAIELGQVPGGKLSPHPLQVMGMSLLFAGIIGLLCLVVMDSWPPPWMSSAKSDSSLEIVGRALNREEGAALEAQVAKEPDNRDLRIQLVWFYGQNRFRVDDEEKPTYQEAYERHYQWMAEHEPRLTPPWHLRAADGAAYDKAKATWLAHVNSQHDDPDILYKAAEFLDDDDPELAVTLIQDGKKLAPDAFEWDGRLADVDYYREHGEWPSRGNYAKPLVEPF